MEFQGSVSFFDYISDGYYISSTILPMFSAFKAKDECTYRFKKYLVQCGIEDANFHALRHTFATRCVESGFELKSLSEILGHANVNVTLNRYKGTEACKVCLYSYRS